MFTSACATISWLRCLLAALLCLLCTASAAFANPVASSTMANGDIIRSATTKSEWLICSKSDTSLRSNCSIATEKMLLERSTDDLESIFYDGIKPYEDLYRESYESVIKNATAIIEGAEKDAPWVLRNVYDGNRAVFDRLYMGLVWYTRTTTPLMRGQLHQKREFSVSPARSLRQLLRSFTAELAEQLIQSRTPHLSYRLSASQLRCLAGTLRSSNDSSESQAGEHIANLLDESLFASLEKPLIVIRVWLNVYLAVAKFTKDVVSQFMKAKSNFSWIIPSIEPVKLTNMWRNNCEK